MPGLIVDTLVRSVSQIFIQSRDGGLADLKPHGSHRMLDVTGDPATRRLVQVG